MGGFFGVASKKDCVFDLFFGTDYHSHLGTRRAGMAVYDKDTGFDRAIHNLLRSVCSPFYYLCRIILLLKVEVQKCTYLRQGNHAPYE